MNKKIMIVCLALLSLVVLVGCEEEIDTPEEKYIKIEVTEESSYSSPEHFDSLIELINKEEDSEWKTKLQKTCFIIVYDHYDFTDDNPESKILTEMITTHKPNKEASDKVLYAYLDLLRCLEIK